MCSGGGGRFTSWWLSFGHQEADAGFGEDVGGGLAASSPSLGRILLTMVRMGRKLAPGVSCQTLSGRCPYVNIPYRQTKGRHRLEAALASEHVSMSPRSSQAGQKTPIALWLLAAFDIKNDGLKISV